MRDRIRRKKFLLPVLLLFVSVYLLTAVACTSSDSGKTGGEAKEEQERVLTVLPEEAQNPDAEGTFFNRADSKTDISNAKQLGGSKTLGIIRTEQQDYTEEEEPEITTTWIPGIW